MLGPLLKRYAEMTRAEKRSYHALHAWVGGIVVALILPVAINHWMSFAAWETTGGGRREHGMTWMFYDVAGKPGVILLWTITAGILAVRARRQYALSQQDLAKFAAEVELPDSAQTRGKALASVVGLVLIGLFVLVWALRRDPVGADLERYRTAAFTAVRQRDVQLGAKVRRVYQQAGRGEATFDALKTLIREEALPELDRLMAQLSAFKPDTGAVKHIQQQYIRELDESKEQLSGLLAESPAGFEAAVWTRGVNFADRQNSPAAAASTALGQKHP